MTVLFWIKSGRGFHAECIIDIPADSTKADIKERLEDWYSRASPSRSDTVYEYGWRKVKVPKIGEARRQYRIALDRREYWSGRIERAMAFLSYYTAKLPK